MRKIKNNFIKNISFLLLLITFVFFSGFNYYNIYAQDSYGFDDQIIKIDNFAIDEPVEVISQQQIENERFLANLKSELRATQKELYDTKSNMLEVENKLSFVHSQISTLHGQISNLDEQILDTELMIKNVLVQIVEKENRIKLLLNDIKVKNIEINNQKSMLSDYLLALYEFENDVSDTTIQNKKINTAKLLLSDDSISEQLKRIRYFNILEKTGHDLFGKLEGLTEELLVEEAFVEKQKSDLIALNELLLEEKNSLNIQKKAKENLLEQTRGEESVYLQLLHESYNQQVQIQEDIKVLKEALVFIQEKMIKLGDKFNVDDYKNLFTGEKISIYGFINETKDVEFVDFEWPVNPSRGISAFFRDPSYASFFGVRHNAIDIRVPQETVIRAPADGVVYKTQDNGYGYSYLILAHEGGYMTVYGHIPQFLVEPGEKIYKGQSVALTGGTPGTKGAGLMTTGAHLHFEIMKDGSYVDPMYYLPLKDLPFSLPEKYSAFIYSEVEL